MSLTVLGASVSPYVRKVRVVLEEKGIPYKLEPISPFQPPEGWRDVSPLGRIPVLKDDSIPGGGTLPDSSVICSYLERKYPTPALMPSDPFEHARVLWFEEYADSDFIANGGRPIFFAIVINQLRKQPPDIAAAKDAAKTKLPPFLDYLDRNIEGREFYVGNTMTLADISVAAPFFNLKHAGYELDAKRWPSLAAFLGRMHSRASFEKLYAEEKPVFHKAVEPITS